MNDESFTKIKAFKLLAFKYGPAYFTGYTIDEKFAKEWESESEYRRAVPSICLLSSKTNKIYEFDESRGISPFSQEKFKKEQAEILKELENQS